MRRSTLGLLISSVVLLSSTVEANTVNTLFAKDMLGVNYDYFKAIAQIPARKSFGDTHIFRIEGCNIEVDLEGDVISELALEITPSCQPDMEEIAGSYAPAKTPFTFGDMLESTDAAWSYGADCLASCGNAFDPSMYAIWKGPRAANNINIKLEFVMDEDIVIEASNHWIKAIKSELGEEAVFDGSYNCSPTIATDQAAAKALSTLYPDFIRIGYWLAEEECD